MKVEFSEKFSKEIRNIHQLKIKKSLVQFIETAKSADSINELSKIKKLKGYENIYRARLGEYRVGLILKNEVLSFETILHPKDIYKNFP